MKADEQTRFREGHEQLNTGRTWFKRGQTAWNKNQTQKTCLYCGNNFNVPPSEINRKYCSHRCYVVGKVGMFRKENNKLFKGYGKCIECGAKINRHKKYCAKHMNIPTSGENHWNWQGGKNIELYPLGWTDTFREQIRFRDGYKCQKCGMPEIENRRKLSVHHIDCNKANLEPKNLMSLCTGCHALVHKPKRRNKSEKNFQIYC